MTHGNSPARDPGVPIGTDHSPPPDEANQPRRAFFGRLSGWAMLVGLVGGYGTFAGYAARYLFPARRAAAWLFVAPVRTIAPGQFLSFDSPGGVAVVVKRASGPDADGEPRLEEFVALSSTCPHLGCRVHWEAHNNRFFCPCHNGQFDPDGHPTGGPVLASKQQLPRYPLKIEKGLLFIQMAPDVVGRRDGIRRRVAGLVRRARGGQGLARQRHEEA